MAATWAIGKVIGWIDDAIHATERLIEAGEEARQKIQDINDVYNEKSSFNAENASRFETLSAGVNQRTNDNISLTNEEYEEYLSLCNQIAEIYPQLVTGYDSQGNAILNLGTSAQTATEQLNGLLEKQKEVSDYQKRDLVDTDVTSTLNEIKELEKQRKAEEEYLRRYNNVTSTANEDLKNRLKESMEKASDETFGSFTFEFSLDDDIGSINELKEIMGKYGYYAYGERVQENENKRLLDFMGMPTEEEIEAILNEWQAEISDSVDEAAYNAVEQEGVLQGLDTKLKEKSNQLLESAITSLETSSNYKRLPEAIQNMLRESLNNIDWLETVDGNDNFSMNDFIDNFIMSATKGIDIDGVQNAIDKIYSLQSEGVEKLTSKEYVEQINEQLDNIKKAYSEAGLSEDDYLDLVIGLGIKFRDENGNIQDSFSSLLTEIVSKAGEGGELTDNLNLDTLTAEQVIELHTIVTDPAYGGTVKQAIDDMLGATQDAIDNPEPLSFAPLFETTDEGSLNNVLDNFQSKMSTIQDTMDQLSLRENIDLTDLGQALPELAGKTDDLNTSLGNLKVDAINDLISQFQNLTSELTNPNEIEFASNYLQSLIDSYDFSDVDTSKVKEQIASLFVPDSDDPKSEQLAIQSAQGLYDKFAAELETGYGKDILLKLSLDPRSADWSAVQWREEFDKQLNAAGLSEQAAQILNYADAVASAVHEIETSTATIGSMTFETPGLDAYNKALKSENEGSLYESLKSAYEKAKELYDQGLVGTDDFKEAAKLFSPNGMDDVANFEENLPKIERYMTDDVTGVQNFLDDLESKGYATIEIQDTATTTVDYKKGEQEQAEPQTTDVDYKKSDQEEPEPQTTQVNYEKGFQELPLPQTTHVNYELGYQALKKEQQMHYSLLVSAIDPHFIYNTLNTITFLAHLNKTEEIASLNCALIGTLKDRLAIKNLKIYDTLQTEKEVLEQYMLIQSYLCHNTINYRFEADETDLDLLVPKNILQPLVENSIKHGLLYHKDPVTHKLLDGSILIKASRRGLGLTLTVTDNGVGISRESIEKYFELPLEKIPEGLETEHIGIYNIRKRLHYLYQQNFQLTAKNLPGCGCTVTLFLPI